MNKPVSQIIKDRIKESGSNYFSNANISNFIKDEQELDALQEEVKDKVQSLLESLVIDTENDHNTQDTAKRVAKMYVKEIFGGRYKKIPDTTAFPNVSEYNGLYVTGPIAIRSTCAHHLQNITGNCWIGIFPGDQVIGLSKFNRITDWIASRPQIQEELTVQIADEIQKQTRAKGVAVLVKAAHHCMTHRGVKAHDSDMTTTVLRGEFLTNTDLKQEFLKVVMTMKGMTNG